jgi:outer membrane protein OmpA-like peptidoglycan-associated protein
MAAPALRFLSMTHDALGASRKGEKKMKINFCRIMIALLVSGLFLIGCADAPLKVKPVDKSQNPTDLAKQLGADIASAKEKQVDVLSPTWFNRAQESSIQAQSGLKKGTALADILKGISSGRAQLEQAEKYAEKSRFHLPDVIKSRNAAIKAGATQFKKEYASIESDFIKMAEAVEEDNIKYVSKKKKDVNDRYRALELRGIKHTELSEVRKMMQFAKDGDFDETAPKSFVLAQNKLDDAELYITRNRYANEGISQKVRDAKFYAQRLYHLSGTSKKLDKMESEEISLWMESYLHRSSMSLKGSDRRNLSFDGQQEEILSDIVNIKQNRSASAAQLEAKAAEIEQLKQRIADLEGSTYKERAHKERLAAEKKFNALYTQVQRSFTDQEAEVYKKGQQCIIRLKAIQFPVGQAVIVPSNYALLTKVQKAIHTFGRPMVRIEGHTDSTGSEGLNRRLSHDRAQAVKKYLVANATLPDNKISALGYGSSRPLVSNETAVGRAINRRIDVVIKARMQ